MVSFLLWPHAGQVMVDSAITGFLHLPEAGQTASPGRIS